MKKSVLLAAILCCAMTTGSMLAQTTDWSKYFTMKELGIRTTMKFTFDFNADFYHGEQLWAGLQNIIYVLRYDNPDEDPINIDSQKNDAWLTDTYGRIVRDVPEIKEEWEDLLEQTEWGVNAGDISPDAAFDLARGGEYVFNAVVDFLNIERHDPITIYDDPSLRIATNSPVVKVGENVEVVAYFNTGYPYDINSLTGDEYADVTLYKTLTDTTALQLDKKRFALTKLKDEAHPLLAGIDTVTVKMEKPEPGEYVLRYETNWEAVKSRDFIISVNDTLRASAKLDKDAYDLASDKQARISLAMDYRYPHIHAVNPDILPTIRVAATLLKDEETTETLMTDTLILANDTLAYKDLNYIGDMVVDFSQIDASKLEEGDFTYQLKVSILFNNDTQFETVLPVHLKSVPTAIQSHLKSDRNGDDAVYSLSGLRSSSAPATGELSEGLRGGRPSSAHRSPRVYIRKAKKIIIN